MQRASFLVFKNNISPMPLYIRFLISVDYGQALHGWNKAWRHGELNSLMHSPKTPTPHKHMTSILTAWVASYGLGITVLTDRKYICLNGIYAGYSFCLSNIYVLYEMHVSYNLKH